jgi:SAM-dependent methyltransferase
MSWGHILRLLDLPAGSGASVLEYGPGSGQILLMLARLGCRAFGVDIDAGALAAIRAQAEAMGVEVATERARFGEGFEGRRFDRVVFFEAFHHAFDFQAVMRGLHARLEPGGRVVFCGEPIVPAPGGAVPYPWGPRLDGLSVFCMQRFGWMELGFTRDFFLAAMRRAGWRVRHHPFPGCGRADAFVAEPLSAAEARGDYELRPAAIGADPGEWGVPEAAHVWTVGPVARIPLLHGPDALVDVTLRAANFLPVKKRVRVSCGDRAWEGVLRPGTAEAAIVLRRCSGTEVRIECQLHSPMELVPGSADARRLGVAVLGLRSVAVPGAS